MAVTAEIVQASRDFLKAAHRSPTLYELTAEAVELLDKLDSAETDEEQAQILAELDLNDLLVQGKVESYVAVVEELKSLSAGRKAAAKRLRQRADIADAAIERLKDRLLDHMQRTERQRFETALFTVRRQLNPPSAEVYDESAVPGQFVEIRTEHHIKVREIIAHVKATGEMVDGVRVSQREGLRIS